ncbi:MAG: TRAP transporter small permease [Lachnospiraceae bacterium]|nr:TRAP transporter small permease [Lachnospiraceae bacterium]
MNQFKKFWEPIDRVIFGLVKYVCVFMLAALVIIVFYIFLGRYVFHNSPTWGEPLSLFLLTWMSILGSSTVLRTDEHLKVTMFDEKLGKKGVLATDILATILVLIFALFMIIYGAQLMTQARNNMMGGIKIPYRYMYLAMPVTGIVYIFALVSQWVRRLPE